MLVALVVISSRPPLSPNLLHPKLNGPCISICIFFTPKSWLRGAALFIQSLPGGVVVFRVSPRLNVDLGGEKALIGYGMVLSIEWGES